jgi:DNA-binding beta-propeller fold protein YncE
MIGSVGRRHPVKKSISLIVTTAFAGLAIALGIFCSLQSQAQGSPPKFEEQETPAQKATSKGTAPLKLVRRYEFPSDLKTRFDHLFVEVNSHRVFTTPSAAKSVMVFDLKSRKLIHTISGIENPHHLLYREDLNRLYVTDGGGGSARFQRFI